MKLLKPGIQCVLAPIWTTYDLRLFADNLDYHFEPKEVYEVNIPGDTFRVLMEKEVKQFEKYMMKRPVFEA